MDSNEKLRQKIAEMSAEALDRSIKTAMENILAGEESALADAQLLAELVAEQRKRQRVAKARIGEYFRQRALHAKQESWRKNAPEPKDVIDEVSVDQYTGIASLRYSDIEILAPAVERDTKAAFMAEQKRRLAAVLEAYPKLTDKQRELLEQVVKMESRVSQDYKHGTSYGALDGRAVNGLIKRGLLATKSWGGTFSRSSILIIAKLPE